MRLLRPAANLKVRPTYCLLTFLLSLQLLHAQTPQTPTFRVRVDGSRADGASSERPTQSTSFGWHGLIGESPTMRRLFWLAERVARSECTVLILGETGTGKERLARALHDRSARAAGPFVAVNSTALPETLFEATFFGHERGAYTGAERARKGVFEEARGGTLFLDEIGDLAHALQAKLLRVLEERTVRPLGGGPVVIDVRIVAATNADLATAVAGGRFRADLFHRLKEFELVVPPLRERGADVRLLLDHFLRTLSHDLGHPMLRLSEAARAHLEAYRWPGNVRELRSVLRSALLLAEGATIEPGDLPTEIRTAAPSIESSSSSMDRAELVPLRLAVGEVKSGVERRQIERALAMHATRKAAATALGINRRTLYSLIARYGIVAARQG